MTESPPSSPQTAGDRRRSGGYDHITNGHPPVRSKDAPIRQLSAQGVQRRLSQVSRGFRNRPVLHADTPGTSRQAALSDPEIIRSVSSSGARNAPSLSLLPTAGSRKDEQNPPLFKAVLGRVYAESEDISHPARVDSHDTIETETQADTSDANFSSARHSKYGSSIVDSQQSSEVEDVDRLDKQFPPLRRTMRRPPPALVKSRQHAIAEQLQRIESPVRLASEPNDDGSEQSSDFALEDQRIKLWRDLHEQRRKIEGLRENIRRKRRHVHFLQRQSVKADNACIGLIRNFLVKDHTSLESERETVLERFQEMQSRKNDYLYAEEEYHDLEKDMDAVEASLENAERLFFSSWFEAQLTQSESNGPESPMQGLGRRKQPVPYYLTGISGDRSTNIHPRYQELLDAVAERTLANEHHTDLLRRWSVIIDNLERGLKIDLLSAEQQLQKAIAEEDTPGGKQFRRPDFDKAQANIASLRAIVDRFQTNGDVWKDLPADRMSEEDYEFLQEYEDNEMRARDKVMQTEQTVTRLAGDCKAKGLMPHSAYYNEDYSIFYDIVQLPQSETHTLDIQEEEDLSDEEEEEPATTRFTGLLSTSRHLLGDEPLTIDQAWIKAQGLPREDPETSRIIEDLRKEHGISNVLSQFENRFDYVNRWLLHRLRISPLEIDQLFSVFSTMLRVIDVRRWQNDVLYWWPRDGTDSPPNQRSASVSAPAAYYQSRPVSLYSIQQSAEDSAMDIPHSPTSPLRVLPF